MYKKALSQIMIMKNKLEINFLLNNKKESFILINTKDGFIIKNKKQKQHLTYLLQNNELSIHKTKEKIKKNKHKNIKQSESIYSIVKRIINYYSNLQEYKDVDLYISNSINVLDLIKYVLENNIKLYCNIISKNKIILDLDIYQNMIKIKKGINKMLSNKKPVTKNQLKQLNKKQQILLNSKNDLLIYKNNKIYLVSDYIATMRKNKNVFNEIIFKQSDILIKKENNNIC